jgi:hypothetical protein
VMTFGAGAESGVLVPLGRRSGVPGAGRVVATKVSTGVELPLAEAGAGVRVDATLIVESSRVGVGIRRDGTAWPAPSAVGRPTSTAAGMPIPAVRIPSDSDTRFRFSS